MEADFGLDYWLRGKAIQRTYQASRRFISSCFVHIRKPDVDLYQLALDCAQVQPEQAVYIDDRPMFVEVACNLGIRCIHHLSYELTRESLAALSLSLE